MLANASNKSLACALEDKGVGVQEWVLGLVLVHLLLLESGWLVVLVDSSDLLNLKVGRLNDDAVSGDLVTRLESDDVTNKELPHVDGLGGADFAAKDGQLLLAVEALQLDELGVLAVVVPGSDQHTHDEGSKNEHTFNPTSLRLDNHARDDAEDGENSNEHDESVVESILD